MKETIIKNSCCSRIIKYVCAAQKSLLLFCAAHRNKQKYFNAFALLWDDTKNSNCPGRAGFAKARYMKSFSILQMQEKAQQWVDAVRNGHLHHRNVWFLLGVQFWPQVGYSLCNSMATYEELEKCFAETVLSNSIIGRGNQNGSAGLQDGECRVLLSRATAPRSQSFNCHVQQAANAFWK
jgi:hypothetical protein